MNQLLKSKDVIGIKLSNGWTSSEEMPYNGVVIWQHKKTKQMLYATPNYDAANEVPFEFHEDYDNGGKHIISLKFDRTLTLEEKKKIYLATVKLVIDTYGKPTTFFKKLLNK